MKPYVALLRAVNLGSRNKVSMGDLRATLADLGFEDVSTYVQSGNVVFKARGGKPADLARSIEERIRRDLGVGTTVLLRTGAELAALVAGNPFTQADPASVHVTFLAEKPGAAAVRGLDPARSDPDEFRVAGREVYLLGPNGYGRSKFTNAYFEKQLGVAATTRNWRTVTKLAELARA